jgi:cytochrome c oxidase subunit II
MTFALASLHAVHDAFSPAGPQSLRIERLIVLFVGVCTIVYLLVLLFVIIGITQKRAIDPTPITRPDPARERRIGIFVSTCVGITIVILFGLLLKDYVTGRAMHQFSYSGDPVSIVLTGHQWWWEVKYDDKQPTNVFTTANEIHIPTGRPVKIFLQSADVIHSFWVPSLQGKKDLVPNHSTAIWLQADTPGMYDGQCAEFCGYEHAKMRLYVIADEPGKFESWLVASRKPAAEPVDDVRRMGQHVFLSSTCVMCHTITGTPAGARLGPDLTHIASRNSLAAGSLPNMPGHLAGWIVDPQRIKPGVHMPQNNLRPQDLQALLEYLESLQ